MQTGPVKWTARAVVVAAGASVRMREASGVRKPLIELGGRSLIEHTVSALSSSTRVTSIVIVAHPEDARAMQTLAQDNPTFAKVIAVVPGGAERTDSVRAGVSFPLEATEPPFSIVAIHDAARPFVSADAIDRVVERAGESGAALLALPLNDTLKRSSDGGEHVSETLDRSALYRAQTPQCFERERFLNCLDRAGEESWSPTDDSALWERFEGPVAIVPGEPENRKITDPADLVFARALIDARDGKETK